jgi:glycosyltransferase involved in cell wall biosynthesis
MNIGFEAKRVFTNFTGLGNYGRFIIHALSEYYPANEYYLYTPRLSSQPEVHALTQQKNVHVVKPGGLFSKPVLSSLWRTWGISRHQTVSKLSIFHGLSQELPVGLPAHVRKVVTVHDLIFLRYPELYNPIDVKIYTTKVRKACHAADAIVAISEQTSSDIQSMLGTPADKIKVVYQGCHPEFKSRVMPEEIEKVRLRYKLPPKYILNVGTIEERKNLLLLIQAMALMPEASRVPVVVIGRKTRYFAKVLEEISRHRLRGWVIFIHDASFTDFPAIYQGAVVFVYPSLFEGFGIPLIEAIASGIPVITSTGSCFLEAAGPDSIYIDKNDAHALASNLVAILETPDKRQKMISRSTAYISRFEPPEIASSLMAVYESLR